MNLNNCFSVKLTVFLVIISGLAKSSTGSEGKKLENNISDLLLRTISFLVDVFPSGLDKHFFTKLMDFIRNWIKNVKGEVMNGAMEGAILGFATGFYSGGPLEAG